MICDSVQNFTFSMLQEVNCHTDETEIQYSKRREDLDDDELVCFWTSVEYGVKNPQRKPTYFQFWSLVVVVMYRTNSVNVYKIYNDKKNWLDF